jgi:N-methylhydantoinase B
LWGGKHGSHGDFLLRLPGENDFRPMEAPHYPVPLDSEVIVRTGGGGGWGDPLERDPALVRSDVVEQLVSRNVAAETYGVVLRDDLTLDEAATAQRRNALRSAAKRQQGQPVLPR